MLTERTTTLFVSIFYFQKCQTRDFIMVEQYYHSIFWGKKKGFVIKGQNLFFVARRGRPEGVPQIMCDVYIITLLDGRPTWSPLQCGL